MCIRDRVVVPKMNAVRQARQLLRRTAGFGKRRLECLDGLGDFRRERVCWKAPIDGQIGPENVRFGKLLKRRHGDVSQEMCGRKDLHCGASSSVEWCARRRKVVPATLDLKRRGLNASPAEEGRNPVTFLLVCLACHYIERPLVALPATLSTLSSPLFAATRSAPQTPETPSWCG